MPNYVYNEVTFENVKNQQRQQIIKAICNRCNGNIDFAIPLPMPLNVYRGNCGEAQEKAFPDTWSSWCTKNWGTKWNALKHDDHPMIIEQNQQLILHFTTAWSAPRGWILALFNRFQLPFSLLWMGEGDNACWHETYQVEDPHNPRKEMWKCVCATPEETLRMGKLLHGPSWPEDCN